MFRVTQSKGITIFAGVTLLFLGLLLAIFTTTSAFAQEDIPEAKTIKFWDDREPESLIQVNHDAWQSILDIYVDDQHPSGINRFNYEGVTADDRTRLKQYLSYLKVLEPRQLNQDEAKAYWINLYNALLVDIILDEVRTGEISSVRDIRSSRFRPWPWTKKSIEVLFQELTLDDIEHGILRPIFKDPRIHFAICHAGLGSPNILKTAFNGENNEELLNKAESDYLNHSRAVDVQGNELLLSSIFEWYGGDFGINQAAVREYIGQRVSEPTRVSMAGAGRLSYRYDWGLNGKVDEN